MDNCFTEEGFMKIDSLIDEIQDAIDDVMSGDSQIDGDIIDTVALTTLISKEVEREVDYEEYERVDHSTKDIVDNMFNIAVSSAPLELGIRDDEDDIDAEDLLNIDDDYMNEAMSLFVNEGFTIDCIIGGLRDNEKIG